MEQPVTGKKRSLPPIEKRWKKGVSGNPSGRPRKQDSLTTLLKAEMEKICPADKEQRTWSELIVRATLQLAMKGNPAALREVWDRLEGKMKQSLEHSGAENQEIQLRIIYPGDENANCEEQ